MERKQTPRCGPPSGSQRGFTLVEIMVVIVILGLLATVVVPNVLGASEDANLGKAKSDVASLKQVVDTYMIRNMTNRELPTWEELITPDDRGYAWLEGYSEAPKDPWGNEYELRQGDRGRRDFEILCWGPDGMSDSEDDISSRTIKDSE